MHSNKNYFDKLDKKCIQQLPLIIDVISSTFNKIKSLYNPFYEEVKEILKNELKKKKNWHISPRDLGMIFYPFSEEEITNNTKISTLSNYFGLWGDIEIYSGGYQWNKRKASFYVALVFEYGVEEDGSTTLPYSYFQIENLDPEKFGTLATKKFYSNLCKSAQRNNFKPELIYPAEDNDEEAIWLPCYEFDADKITDAYNTFRDKILIPFIRQL